LLSINRFLEFDELRRELKAYYSAIGRPSVDPKLMIRMPNVGYRFGICSERRLCEEVHINLAYRWFCRLSPERIEDLSKHSPVSFDESMNDHRVVKWLKTVAPNATITARNNSILGLMYAARSGIGTGPLPTAIADTEPDLVRVP